MAHPDLVWRKTYRLNPYDEVSDFIVVSKKNDGTFYAVIFYWKENFNSKYPPEPQFKLETPQFARLTEAEIMTDFTNWIGTNLGKGKYVLDLKEHIVF